MKLTKTILISAALLTALSMASFNVLADSASKGKKTTYTEDQFLSAFSGKSRKAVTEKLGPPARKEVSVKPSSADNFVSAYGKANPDKPDNVDIWYYDNIVTYAPKKTYKFAELTFLNDRCSNIAFFNTKK